MVFYHEKHGNIGDLKKLEILDITSEKAGYSYVLGFVCNYQARIKNGTSRGGQHFNYILLNWYPQCHSQIPFLKYSSNKSPFLITLAQAHIYISFTYAFRFHLDKLVLL